MLSRSSLIVLSCATAGLLIGLVMQTFQSPHLPMMNSFGVVAFFSMGASLGCLVCEAPKP